MCLINIQVKCPHCHSAKVVKNGKRSTGRQVFLCRNCGRQFQAEYFYQGADPLVKPQLQSSLLHGSGIRDCTKIFGISPKATLNFIERQAKSLVTNPRLKRYERVQIDELYSFVNEKGKKVWFSISMLPKRRRY